MRKLMLAFAFSAFPVVALAADAELTWLFSVPDPVQPPAAPAAGGAPGGAGLGGGAGGAAPAVPAGMPAVVAVGRGQEVRACRICHTPSGSGQPENANLRGLPAVYFEDVMMDFKTGAFKGARATAMTQMTKNMTDAEVKETAAYYAAMKPVPWTKVVEADTVPKTFVVPAGARRQWPGGGTEPLGNRIIEFAEEPAKLTQPDAQLAFTAYVPRGSIAKGEALVVTGGAGKTTACASCHGPNSTGVGIVPGIAGRSPLYLARQMALYQNGDRGGPNAAVMKTVVANLQLDDIVAIAAYLGTRNPS